MKEIQVDQILDIGICLSKEKDSDKRFESILTAAMDITNCDGGTLYHKEPNHLVFKLMFTRSTGIKQGGRYAPIQLPPVPLSHQNVCSSAALNGQLINIDNVYENRDFDFSGPRRYDAITGYKTQSMLVVPMEDDEGNCIGVLQLINALNDEGEIISFNKRCEHLLMSLASMTAICQVNMDYAQEIESLLDSLVRVMSTAIDARTPYNANHTRNMVKYGERFIDWLTKTNDSWQFSEKKRHQFLMSVWLHDAGKITTPLQVMDKESRLGEALQGVENRFRVIGLLDQLRLKNGEINEAEYEKQKNKRLAAQQLVLKANSVGFLPAEMLEQIKNLGKDTFIDEDGIQRQWLTKEELISLSVPKGTLTDAERSIMENHVLMTSKMLAEVKFPANYSKVPEWAGSHHEFLNGTGYPNGIQGGDIDREVRLLTILDIFDALTARDRPYKAPTPVGKALSIMESMVEEGKIDGQIFKMFTESAAWEDGEPDGVVKQ